MNYCLRRPYILLCHPRRFSQYSVRARKSLVVMAKRGSVDEGLPSKKRPKSSEEHHCPNVSRYTSWTSEEVLEFFSLRAPPEVADRYRSRGKLKSLLKRIFG